MNTSIFKKLVGAAAVAVMLGFAVSANAQSSGWPSAAILNKYGISGMPAPAGATNITHQEYAGDDEMGEYGPSLGIMFGLSNAAVEPAVRDWLTQNDWKREVIFGQEVYTKNVRFPRGNFDTYVTFYINDGVGNLGVSWDRPRP